MATDPLEAWKIYFPKNRSTYVTTESSVWSVKGVAQTTQYTTKTVTSLNSRAPPYLTTDTSVSSSGGAAQATMYTKRTVIGLDAIESVALNAALARPSPITETSPSPSSSIGNIPSFTAIPQLATVVNTLNPTLTTSSYSPSPLSSGYPPIAHETLIIALAIGSGLFFVILLVLVYPLILWRSHKRRERLSEIGEVVLQRPLQVTPDPRWNWKMRPVSEAESTAPVLQNAVKNGVVKRERERERDEDDDVEMGMVMRVGTWQPRNQIERLGKVGVAEVPVVKPDVHAKEAVLKHGLWAKGRAPVSEEGELEEMPSPRVSHFGGYGWKSL